MKKVSFELIIPGIIVACIGLLIAKLVSGIYFFYVCYAILQMIALAAAWNILGGYTGYVNFGIGGFFAAGAYTSIVLLKYYEVNFLVAILAAGTVSGILGLLIGYLSIRVRGIYFSISTIAVSTILQMVVLNTPFLGGAKGFKIIRPPAFPPFSNYIEFLFLLILLISFFAVAVSRLIEKSWIGRSFLAIKDSEQAAETSGVATLKLKILATVVSCALMGIAGAPYPYFITLLEPYSAMGLTLGTYAFAAVFVGGRGCWFGPIIGAVLLGGLQQSVTVMISSEWNILVVGLVIIAFVLLAPNGVVGLLKGRKKPVLLKKKDRV
ncbi:MAG: branched-chain amino acid ABC transporter permease [Spirochaetales bacterium]|nr:branched-chain amino acid ABC transporter permease [Spirochaetales bacterium]